jgi:hypothetical protein
MALLRKRSFFLKYILVSKNQKLYADLKKVAFVEKCFQKEFQKRMVFKAKFWLSPKNFSL